MYKYIREAIEEARESLRVGASPSYALSSIIYLEVRGIDKRYIDKIIDHAWELEFNKQVTASSVLDVIARLEEYIDAQGETSG